MSADLTIYYYKFTDPKTGLLTKNVGYKLITSVSTGHYKQNDSGEMAIVKQEDKESIFQVHPKAKDKEAITKEEFDALDISGESISATNDRIRFLSMVEKIKEDYSIT